MRIGELARATGFTTQTLRYYGHLGLLEPERAANGYRQYTQAHIERLAFIKRLKHLSLSLEEIREVLEIKDQGRCPCGHLRDRLVRKMAEIGHHIQELLDLQDDLKQLLKGAVPLCKPKLEEMPPNRH